MKQRAVTYADAAVDFLGTDYAKVARALSGNGYVCRSREQLKSALTQALTTERFSVISYEFSGGAYAGRSWTLLAVGTIIEHGGAGESGNA